MRQEKTELSDRDYLETRYFDNGNPAHMAYYTKDFYNGGWCLHHDVDEGPAELAFYEDGALRRERWVHIGTPKRDPVDGPAEIEYTPDGHIASMQYWQDRKRIASPYGDRITGTPHDTVHQDGTRESRGYYTNIDAGILSRDPKDGPAMTRWHENGTVAFESYQVHGRLHRPPADGPAVVAYAPDGTITMQEFWQDNRRTDAPAAQADASLSHD